MNILVLNYEYPPLGGGAAPVAHELAMGLARRGHEVHVLTAGFQDLPKTESLHQRLTVHRVPSSRRRKESAGMRDMFSYVRHVRRALPWITSEYGPFNVCHCHFLIPTGVLVPSLRKRGLHSVVTIHGSDIPGYNPDRFKLFHCFTPPLLSFIAKRTHTVVAPSKYIEQLAVPRLPDSRVIHIPNGIHARYWDTSQPKERIILSTGRLLPRKGFHKLIEALHDVNSGFELHICGDGPMRSQLEKLSVHSKTPVVFHGWLDNRGEQYRNLLARASIYALLSERENASVSLLEAMSSGCAVVTSDVSGCPETVGESGIALPPGDVASLREVLLDLIQNESKRRAIGELAVARAVETFDWKRVLLRYEAVLIETAESSN